MTFTRHIRTICILAVIAVCAFAPGQSLAQSPELGAVYRKYEELNKQEKYLEAVPIAKKLIEMLEKEFGSGSLMHSLGIVSLAKLHSYTSDKVTAQKYIDEVLAKVAHQPNSKVKAGILFVVAEIYEHQGRLLEAEVLAKNVLRFTEAKFGNSHEHIAEAANLLADINWGQKRFSEAVALYKRALQIINKSVIIYKKKASYAEAEPLLKRALAIRKKVLGPEHPDTALSLNNLSLLYQDWGRYAAAEPLLKRALAIREKQLGPEHQDTAISLNNLALNYKKQSRYAEAERLFKRALAIDEKTLGPKHPLTSVPLGNLAMLYTAQGRYADSEPLYKRALAIFEKALGPEHPNTAISFNNLARLYTAQGRYAEAEPLYKRALLIQEKVLGPEHPSTAATLGNLASLYRIQGRYPEAETLYKRTLDIHEKVLGLEHPDTSVSLNNLAGMYNHQGRYADAEPLYRRALVIKEKALGPEHPSTAISLSNLAGLYQDQNRYAEAEHLYKRALAIQEKVLGPDHWDIAILLNNLASVNIQQGSYAVAEVLYQRALAIKEKTLGPEHPDTAFSLKNLGLYYNHQGRYAESLRYTRRFVSSLQSRLVRNDQSVPGKHQRARTTQSFSSGLIAVYIGASDTGLEPSNVLASESFEVMQLGRVSSTGNAIRRMAARFASGSGDVTSLVRARQDAVNQWQVMDKALISALGKPPDKRNKGAEDRLRADLSTLDTRITELGEKLSEKFPKLAAIIAPRPVRLQDIQSLLATDEALITYLTGINESYLWVVRRDDTAFKKLEISTSDLANMVRDLRGGLDLTGVADLSELQPFDTSLAHALYQKLFAPAEKMLQGVNHIMLVLDGALQSLPLGVLVTTKPKQKIREFSDYRRVPWLAKKYALTVLPSVASLKSLRLFAQKSRAPDPFIGFGDPALSGVQVASRAGGALNLFRRGPIADAETIHSLGPLPETADELRSIATTLGAGEQAIFLRDQATEGAVKDMTLSDARVVAFATHGLIAGELKGLSEPGLVFSPPVKGTDKDDGFLTASEVAQLKLNADWVILSACNTAAPDGTPGAEGLSGLAKAFFYAGTRSLLVSHWPVLSEAAKALTTGMFLSAKDKTTGRSEALKRSMMAFLDTPAKPYYTHPAFWAPFSIVGEGR